MALTARWSRLAPGALIAAIAIAIAWVFAATTLRHTRPMALPLDDSYLYLTYARQLGRGEPFSYFPGGGYPAGATSAVWPLLLAPVWALGARGHALVWASFALCAALHAATALGVRRLVHRLAGAGAGVLAALVLLAIAPLAWCSLSGLEVALASALIVALALLLLDQPATGPPGRRLAGVLAATALSRPEATMLVAAVIAVAVAGRLRRRELRAAAWWCAPLAAPAAWLCANRLLAGQLVPTTGVVDGQFHQPGFDWTFWLDTVIGQTGALVRGLFVEPAGPLVWPRPFALAWLVGALRVLAWARRERRWLAGAVIAGAPPAMMLAVIASSGQWSVHNYRHIAPAFPLLVAVAGCALAPPRLLESFNVAMIRDRRPAYGWLAAAALVVALFARAALPGLVADARLFAQGAADSNSQLVAIGRYIERKLPGATVMCQRAGAIAYHADGRGLDLRGVVTSHPARIANHGPGARFELLERMPREQRPSHFAHEPGWLGTGELTGEVVLRAPLRRGFAPRRLAGAAEIELLVADFDRVGTGELPIAAHPGWRVADRIDVADLASEAAHGWRGELGRRRLGDRGERWSVVGRDVGPAGLVLDGGRTIRGGGERFALALARPAPVRLVLRSGGRPEYPFNERLTRPVELTVLDDDDRPLARAQLPAPAGPFVELAFELPAGITAVRIAATGPYRVYHWFVLQPE